MRDTSGRPAAPNYTDACIVMFGVNLVWMLMLVWALWGILAVGATGWILNRLIQRIAVARG